MTKTFDRFMRANQFNWEQKTHEHIVSRFYDVNGFKRGQSSLRTIETMELGDVKGKRLLHLQCHFGLDTLSWARKGAITVGVDFSAESINYAKSLAAELNISSHFIQSNIYDLKKHLRGKFDIIFVSYGCLGWLPDINQWAEIVAYFLKRKGMLFLVDFHPVYWMLNGTDKVAFPYEGGDKALVFTPQGTYANPKSKINSKEYWWNHGLSKIVNALIQSGLNIRALQEYNYAPYCGGKHMTQRKDGTWIVKKTKEKAPVMFSIKAIKQDFFN